MLQDLSIHAGAIAPKTRSPYHHRAGGRTRPEARRAFFRAYEQRVDSLVTHPLFGYRINYRRLLEIQTRVFARVLTASLRYIPSSPRGSAPGGLLFDN